MSPDTKARLSFVILGTIYFAGGIEHGISVPRGWLHWRHNAIKTPDHVVGLAVAAYSVATFFVAPFVGRWVEKPGRTKRVLLLSMCLHITGAVMDMLQTQHWAAVVARFVSGIGGGADAAVLSETSRYTHPAHRTSAMALLVGGRLLGYLLVPGLDSLLWRVALTDTHLPDQRTAVLGLFLLVMWAALLLLTAALYTELCRLQPLSQHSPQASNPQSTMPHSMDYTHVHVAGSVPSGVGEDYEVVHDDLSFSSSMPVSIPASLTCSQCSESSAHQHLAKSSEMIEEAEKYIQHMAQQSFSTAVLEWEDEGMEITSAESHGEVGQRHEAADDLQDLMSTSFNHDHEKGGSMRAGARRTSGGSVSLSSETLDQNSYVKRSGVLPRRLQNQESLLYIMYEEFIRHDIIALLAITMSGSFAHLCFQMMITPVTRRFLEDEELYSAVLFCLALVLLLLTCGTVWACRPRRRVLQVLGAGTGVLSLGILLFMLLLDYMTTHQEGPEENLASLSVCVGLYVVGLPLLLIPATSLYTLLSSQRNHGLRQGVYHSALSVSAILAPLWIEGTVNLFFLHLGVIVSLLLVSLVTVCCSRQQLSVLHEPVPRRGTAHRHHTCHRPSAARHATEQQPLLS